MFAVQTLQLINVMWNVRNFLVRLSPQIDFYVGAKELSERTAKIGLPVLPPPNRFKGKTPIYMS